MHANSICISCMVNKQEKRIRKFRDERRKSEYMNLVLQFLCEHAMEECTPWLSSRLNQMYMEFWGEELDNTLIKKEYNRLLLEMESAVEEKISKLEEPIRECIKYVCAGNYIDFGAVQDVNEETFAKLCKKAEEERIPDAEYDAFIEDVENAKKLVYLTDNCGEIVLDKIFIRHLKQEYPNLQITVIVRGERVLNDATLEDAKEVGLTNVVRCIGNGSAAPGTILTEINQEAKTLITEADVVISKGQGNFESLYGEGIHPYYFFLCKCELFVERFGLKQFDAVFMKEERMQDI